MIDDLSSFHFLRPWWLVAAPIAIGVWLLWRRGTDPLRGWRSQIDPALLKAVVSGDNKQSSGTSCGLLIVWLLMVVAIAGPTWKLEPSPFAADAPPLMILLKADETMQRGDPPPSRLELAHLKISDLAQHRKGQAMGLIAYAGSAHLVLPPTHDVEVVADMVSEIGPDVMPAAGDRLDLAVRAAGDLLKESGEGGTLLVLADSVDADEQAVASAHNATGSLPVQFLELAGANAPETQSVRAMARLLRARVIDPTPDDSDVKLIASNASRSAATGVVGKSDQWQEAGYWLAPVVAALVALSFRRENSAERASR